MLIIYNKRQINTHKQAIICTEDKEKDRKKERRITGRQKEKSANAYTT